MTGYSIHQRAGDSPGLIPHLEKVRTQLGRSPKKVIADAGYGSEENYVYLEDQEIEAYIKYGTYDREQKKRRKIPEREKYWASNWPYDDQRDEFTCPQGKRLTYEFSRTVRSDNGYRAERRVYQCKECEPCPVKKMYTF